MARSCDVVVIGAGPAGLASAAQLRKRGLEPVILEAEDAIGAAWRRHYDRLHLHTHRRHSSLPDLPMPSAFGRYPSRARVVAYLESYADRFDLKPILRAKVHRVRRDGMQWLVETADQAFVAPAVVVAAGTASFPYTPTWPGMQSFAGPIVHSSLYHNPKPHAGQRVLVVGFGNSGGEIALDLAEAGVDVSLSVRGPVNILPRELLGLPLLSWAIAQSRLPAHIADSLNGPAIRLAVGPIEKFGLTRSAKGPRRSVEEDGKVPVFDIGTLAMIRAGRIKVRGGVVRFEPTAVVFSQSPPEPFDAVILATGFRPDFRSLLPDAPNVLNESGAPLVSGGPTAEPGLFFCGAIVSSTGQLRAIGIEAGRIAHIVASGPSLRLSPALPDHRQTDRIRR